MKSKVSFIPLILFIIILMGILMSRNWTTALLIDQDITTYTTHTLFATGVNILLSLISYLFIKKYKLEGLAGITKGKVQNKWLLLFPVYLIGINLLFMDAIPQDHLFIHLMVLFIYCISIGLSEELALRGVMQSYLIKIFGHSKRGVLYAVIGAGFIFGVLHLFKFDKGLYGELSQVLFAMFIGIMFGAILLRTKRLYPLIILHALIDFAAKLDSIGIPITIREGSEPLSLSNAIITTIVVLPCLIIGILFLRKIDMQSIQKERY